MKSKIVIGLISLTDAILILIAFILAFYLKFYFMLSFVNLSDYIWVLYFSVPLIILILLNDNLLSNYTHFSYLDLIFKTFLSLFKSALICSALLFFQKAEFISRLFLGYFFLFSLILIILEKIIIKLCHKFLIIKFSWNLKALLIGWGKTAQDIFEKTQKKFDIGIDIVQFIDPRDKDTETIKNILKNSIIDEILLIMPRDNYYHANIDKFIELASIFGKSLRIISNINDVYDVHKRYEIEIAGHAGVMLVPHNLDPDELILKRILDIIGAIAGIIIVCIIYIPVAIAIKLDSKGPVIFKQKRIGRQCRRFNLYKFRTMYIDAEERRKKLLENNIHSGPIFKIVDDPRITRVGKFLRKYCIDEFPQFFNVLKGDMSLVGTRPPLADEVSLYCDEHFKRISIKPGITGLWQISGRNEIKDFKEIIQLDIKYIKNWSVFFDLKICMDTIKVLLTGKGI
jgi:exopolysaccharide biosynthesis polyprenyl glycosylphosphotransferase